MNEERDIVVVLEGEIDLSTAPEAEGRISEAEASGPARLIIDLREVTFMDSSGLRVLLSAHKRAEAEGHEFALIRGGDAVERLLEVTGLAERLTVLEADFEPHG